MVIRPASFEFDLISTLNRERQLSLHHNHLKEIRNRKNKFAEIKPLSNVIITPRKNTIFPEVLHTNNIIKDRLYDITHRENMMIRNMTCFSLENANHQKQKRVIKGMNSMKLTKENSDLKKRMEAAKSIFDLKKFEKDFQQSRNLVKKIRRIQVHSQSVQNIHVSKDDCVYFPMLK